MCDQLRRAVTSIPTNLAEGTSRESLKEKVRFVEISYGSLCEVYNLLILALDLGYIGEQELNHMEDEIESCISIKNPGRDVTIATVGKCTFRQAGQAEGHGVRKDSAFTARVLFQYLFQNELFLTFCVIFNVKHRRNIMKKLYISAILILAGLGAYAAVEHPMEVMFKTWTDTPVKEVIKAWGNPSDIDYKRGQTVYKWSEKSSRYIPGTMFQQKTDCTRILISDISGKVVYGFFEGNGRPFTSEGVKKWNKPTVK